MIRFPPGHRRINALHYRRMEKTVQAVYEDGVLRPLEPIPLEDRQEVTVTISDEGDIPRDHPLWLHRRSGQTPLAIHGNASMRCGVRWLTIRGSLSEAVIEERRDR